MKRILLARHGVTSWNQERRFQGCSDIPLTDEGRHQASRLATRVALWKPHRIVTSPLIRARDTAEAVRRACGGHPPCEVSEGLREMSFGAWEGLPVEQLVQDAGESLNLWARDPGKFTPPGGEPIACTQQRALEALNPILAGGDPEERILLVAHGGVISALLLALFSMPTQMFRGILPGNCALSAIHLDPDQRFLVFLNDVLHMAVAEELVGQLPIPA
ncbi:MAG TPA: histidine phosphatase family protein [Synergistaceae bacterium]|mgnify:CR=1 FL=1|nr:histidine phosphatase family protein [Synergistaceae bacterium]HQH78534.1 histidine phosphatase family protein [Synergistaceae bacterium]